MPMLNINVKKKRERMDSLKARKSVPVASSPRPIETLSRAPMRYASSPDGQAPTASTSTGNAVRNPVAV